jgi:hypothetical protein
VQTGGVIQQWSIGEISCLLGMLDFDRKQRSCVHTTHCSDLPALRRSVQTSVTRLTEFLFVEQDSGTAAAINLAVVSQPSDNLGVWFTNLSHQQNSRPLSTACLSPCPLLLSAAIVALSQSSFPIMRIAETFCRRRSLLR